VSGIFDLQVLHARVHRGPAGFHRRTQHGGDLDHAAFEAELADAHARAVEQVVHQARHVARPAAR
jgi:hypothetical protein